MAAMVSPDPVAERRDLPGRRSRASVSRMAALLLAVVMVLSIAPAAPRAWAHAHYAASNPGSGARVSTAPSTVVVTFDDDLDPNGTVLTVLGPRSQNLTAGKTTVTVEAPRVAAVNITPAGSGTYTVKWHAVADDDKAITEGTFTFSVGAAFPPAWLLALIAVVLVAVVAAGLFLWSRRHRAAA